VMAHIDEYFRDLPAEATLPLRALFAGGKGVSGALAARLLTRNIVAIARTFIAGESPEEARKPLQALIGEGRSVTFDILGETALSEKEAQGYAGQYLALTDFLAAELKALPRRQRFPGINLSVKISSLYSRLDPMNYDDSVLQVKERLRPIFRRVKEVGGFVNLDMEMASQKNITLDVFTSLLDEEEFRSWPHAGIAIQAYLRETEADLGRLLAWARQRGTSVTVRLVKGAYWEYESVTASQKGWPSPVFATKGETDRNFERCAAFLFANADRLVPAIATHNVRSLAAAMVAAERADVAAENYEFQMLYGMAEPVKHAVQRLGFPLRDYVPVGPLIPGMAYLVRRLLENTSNEGFLRRTFVERAEKVSLLAEPPLPPPAAEPKQEGLAPFANEPALDLSRPEVREECRAAIETVRGKLDGRYPALIAGREGGREAAVVSVNPARPSEVVGSVAAVSREEAAEAVAAARRAQAAWGGREPAERAAVLFRAADIARSRRRELMAWQVFETGKNWLEADADVAEAIDYFDYYGHEMLRLAAPQRLGDIPGELNLYHYRPRGVGVVIAPWNFPLAISAGMVAAPLVAGNAVLYKPSSLSPVNGWHLCDILREAGVPDGVVNFIPGRGGELGTYLVGHEGIDFVAFTGSREVGLAIAARAAATPGLGGVKKVVAEMGGKNAIIVDADADLDQAVSGVIRSAFGYQGQKCSACSRVIVLAPCYERFMARLAEAVAELQIGPPDDPTFFMGPLIDAAALEKVRRYVEAGRRDGRIVVAGNAPAVGFYHGPVVVADLAPDSPLLREEVFGPVLAVVRAEDLGTALESANATDYALTGGLYSRSPRAIARVSNELAVGNLYINRPITGALVGRQPFGGFRYSGVGSKAGGPDYLQQFLLPRVVTENTMRRGFTPETVG
ncbi:MAG TPA: bifunctional proline dehydrogenase/L-glutamate gamma-semialdehyde dehydrogenase, partial [Geobacteraceae bacterium]